MTVLSLHAKLEKLSRSTGRWEPQMSGPSNNGLHQTRRVGAAASRPVVDARLAGEAECSTDAELNRGITVPSWEN